MVKWFRRSCNRIRCLWPNYKVAVPPETKALDRLVDNLRADPDFKALQAWLLLRRDRRLEALMASRQPDPVDSAEARAFQELYNFFTLTKTEEEE